MNVLTVGKIVNTHALQGEVRVFSQSDFKSERFAKGSALFIKYEGDYVPVKVKQHRVNKTVDLLKFEGLNHINDVEKYKGCELVVSADDLKTLDANEFYYFEIIGCQVRTLSGEIIGDVVDILETGANDCWVVARPGKKDALIPYIAHVVKTVDVEKKLIVIDAIEGLLT